MRIQAYTYLISIAFTGVPETSIIICEICTRAIPKSQDFINSIPKPYFMDLTLFHYNKDGDFRWKDKLSGRTDRLRCAYLEWIGWYNGDILQRLLGHYRLFQIYKKNRLKTGIELSLIRSYILQYQSTHAMKYFVSKLVGFLYNWKKSILSVRLSSCKPTPTNFFVISISVSPSAFSVPKMHKPLFHIRNASLTNMKREIIL